MPYTTTLYVMFLTISTGTITMHSKINLSLKIVLLIESIKVFKTVQLESNVF